MQVSLLTGVLLAASSAIFGQESGKERPKAKDGEIFADISGQKALSYINDDQLAIMEITRPTMKLFRWDDKGGKVRTVTLTGDSGTSESEPGGGLRKITLKGNVRAEEPDGTVTTADEAVIDLIKRIHTYTGNSIRVVTRERQSARRVSVCG